MKLMTVQDIRTEKHIVNLEKICAISFTGRLASLQLQNGNVITLNPEEFERVEKEINNEKVS